MKVRNLLSGVLCLVISCGALAGCSSVFGEKEEIRADTLYVANFQGGLGRKWLDEAIEEYKKINTSAKIEIVEKQSEFNDANLINNMGAYPYDLYFLSDMTYSKYVQQGLFADMTNIVEKKIYDEDLNFVATGATTSILDSMSTDFREVYGLKDKEGKIRYYAIPYYQSPYGFTYDVDLFETEGYSDLSDEYLLREGEKLVYSY